MHRSSRGYYSRAGSSRWEEEPAHYCHCIWLTPALREFVPWSPQLEQGRVALGLPLNLGQVGTAAAVAGGLPNSCTAPCMAPWCPISQGFSTFHLSSSQSEVWYTTLSFSEYWIPQAHSQHAKSLSYGSSGMELTLRLVYRYSSCTQSYDTLLGCSSCYHWLEKIWFGAYFAILYWVAQIWFNLVILHSQRLKVSGRNRKFDLDY